MAIAILRLLRPKQWTKNLLVFAAMLFTAAFDPKSVQLSLMAFVAMCLASSATYVVNDLIDAIRDRNHHRKKDRPIASGAVSTALAFGLVFALAAGALAIAFSINPTCLWLIVAYFCLQAIYNLGFKKIPITDVFLIAIGFVMRAVLGPLALNVTISNWLFVCTMTLALMLGFAKRRDEFIKMGEERTVSRESLGGYSLPILNMMVGIFAGASMISYGIYSSESTTAKANPGLIATAFFVAYGICRYLYRVFHDGDGEEPDMILLTDPHVIASVIGFLITAGLAMTHAWGFGGPK